MTDGKKRSIGCLEEGLIDRCRVSFDNSFTEVLHSPHCSRNSRSSIGVDVRGEGGSGNVRPEEVVGITVDENNVPQIDQIIEDHGSGDDRSFFPSHRIQCSRRFASLRVPQHRHLLQVSR